MNLLSITHWSSHIENFAFKASLFGKNYEHQQCPCVILGFEIQYKNSALKFWDYESKKWAPQSFNAVRSTVLRLIKRSYGFSKLTQIKLATLFPLVVINKLRTNLNAKEFQCEYLKSSFKIRPLHVLMLTLCLHVVLNKSYLSLRFLVIPYRIQKWISMWIECRRFGLFKFQWISLFWSMAKILIRT